VAVTAAFCDMGMKLRRGASAACVRYEGEEYRVPIRHRYFLFVVWDTPFPEDSSLVGFE
jgi:hypothetical protein